MSYLKNISTNLVIKFNSNNFKKIISLLLIILSLNISCANEQNKSLRDNKKEKQKIKKQEKIVCGAERIDLYLPKLKDKRVAMLVNHTAIIKDTHLIDTLLDLGVNIKKIFAPEHGFRGKADAGEKINNSIDRKTQIPIISIYGKNKKPTKEQLKDIDIVVFDIQDVGVRFYTYISTMHYAMEACAENNVKMIITDRPNPNGDYVAGPVLKAENRSFVGMHEIPIVHGCTVGELAMMINGEKWLKNGVQCDLEVIKCFNYKHSDKYIPPIKPSPNLPNYKSIRLYPSLCLFEPTVVSVGRGTKTPFLMFGYPDENMGNFSFTPESIYGMSKNPKYKGKKCYGKFFTAEDTIPQFTIKYVTEMYSALKDKNINFFTNPAFFDKLAGNKELRKQIKNKTPISEIEKSWENELKKYMRIRSKYLLYE